MILYLLRWGSYPALESVVDAALRGTVEEDMEVEAFRNTSLMGQNDTSGLYMHNTKLVGEPWS
jgi:hypothetical protein